MVQPSQREGHSATQSSFLPPKYKRRRHCKNRRQRQYAVASAPRSHARSGLPLNLRTLQPAGRGAPSPVLTQTLAPFNPPPPGSAIPTGLPTPPSPSSKRAPTKYNKLRLPTNPKQPDASTKVQDPDTVSYATAIASHAGKLPQSRRTGAPPAGGARGERLLGAASSQLAV